MLPSGWHLSRDCLRCPCEVYCLTYLTHMSSGPSAIFRKKLAGVWCPEVCTFRSFFMSWYLSIILRISSETKLLFIVWPLGVVTEVGRFLTNFNIDCIPFYQAMCNVIHCVEYLANVTILILCRLITSWNLIRLNIISYV